MEELALFGGEPVRDKLLPYARQNIDEQDLHSVVETMQSAYLTTGPRITEFEEKMARYVGADYGVVFNSGTAALHAAATVAGFGKHYEVITTPMSFAATANCIVYRKATPVFVDINPRTMNLSYEKVRSLIVENYKLVKNKFLVNRKTKKILKGIIPVHFAGHPVRMDLFRRLAQRFNLTLIEDAAHALGASVYINNKWESIGNCKYSDMAIFSFHPVKHITTGEGGLVTTNDRRLYNLLSQFRTHGITRNPDRMEQNPADWYYEMQFMGYNYRMPDINAALGISQLKKAKDWQNRRNNIVTRYLKAFSDIEEIITPREERWARSAWHLFVIRLVLNRLNVDRDQIYKALKAENIGVNVHYMPIYKHPFYQRTQPHIMTDMPVTEQCFKEIITLPLFPTMTEKDTDDVIKAVRKVINYYRKQN